MLPKSQRFSTCSLYSDLVTDFYSAREAIHNPPAHPGRNAVILHQLPINIPATLLTLRLYFKHQHFSNLYKVKLVCCLV